MLNLMNYSNPVYEAGFERDFDCSPLPSLGPESCVMSAGAVDPHRPRGNSYNFDHEIARILKDCGNEPAGFNGRRTYPELSPIEDVMDFIVSPQQHRYTCPSIVRMDPVFTPMEFHEELLNDPLDLGTPANTTPTRKMRTLEEEDEERERLDLLRPLDGDIISSHDIMQPRRRHSLFKYA